jgi:hypothetical protein
MNRPTLAVIALGGATIAAALVWWWATFSTFIDYGNLSWSDAGRCLVRDSDICALAKVLCLSAHPRVFFAYWTNAFWVGVAILSASLWTAQSGRPPRR